jgi:hypothetical protein
MKIGIVAGAMKPFHKGHAVLIEESNRLCDRTIVYTTQKDRGILSGLKMAQAWQSIIRPAAAKAGLSFDLEFVNSPIGSTFKFLQELQESGELVEVYLFQGAEDAKRFNEDALQKYCPDVIVHNMGLLDKTTHTRVASGTQMREFLEYHDFVNFLAYLPQWMRPVAGDYFDFLSPN